MSIMNGTDEGKQLCGDSFCSPGDPCCAVPSPCLLQWEPISSRFDRSRVFMWPQAVPAKEILCCVFQFEVLSSVLILKLLSIEQFL